MVPPSIISQLASTKEYSQPISLARSINFFCFTKSLLLSWSPHQLQAARPGFTQLTSPTLFGSARWCTKLDATMVASVFPIVITRQGVEKGAFALAVKVPVPFPSPACGFAILYTPLLLLESNLEP